MFFIFEEQFIECAVSVMKKTWYISDVVQFFASESGQYFEFRSIADNESIVFFILLNNLTFNANGPATV